MLKAYQVSLFARKIQEVHSSYQQYREMIEEGDISAVERLAQLKQEAAKLLLRIEELAKSDLEEQLKVYLGGMITSLKGTLIVSGNFSKINEKRVSVPWIRQRSNKSQYNTSSHKNTISEMKTPNMSSRQNFRYQSQKSNKFNSNALTSSKSTLNQSQSQKKEKVCRTQIRGHEKQQSTILNRSQNIRAVSPFSRKSSSRKPETSKTFKNSSSSPLTPEVNQQNLQRCLFSQPQIEGILRIKITPDQLQQIMRLREQLKR